MLPSIRQSLEALEQRPPLGISLPHQDRAEHEKRLRVRWMLLYQGPCLSGGIGVATKLHQQSCPKPSGVALHGPAALSRRRGGLGQPDDRFINLRQSILRVSLTVQQPRSLGSDGAVIGLARKDRVDLPNQRAAVAEPIELQQEPHARRL